MNAADQTVPTARQTVSTATQTVTATTHSEATPTTVTILLSTFPASVYLLNSGVATLGHWPYHQPLWPYHQDHSLSRDSTHSFTYVLIRMLI